MSRIDVHHHAYPDVYKSALEKAGGDPSGWYVPPWTLAADRDLNKLIGVETAILSMTAPGPCIEKDPKAAALLARRGNQAMAALRDSMPNKYGFFASVPSPLDQASCLAEIAHGLDELHADGVILFTRYGEDNHYLGHPDFRPIWDELNRRRAVVFVHPTHPVDKTHVNPHLPQPMFDYAHETGRTAMDLILSGILERSPQCKIILSHAGGTLPWLIYRPAGMLPHTPFGVGKSTDELVALAQRFYFDTALSATPYTLPLLLQFAKPGHILFGSDFPNAPTPGIEFFTGNLASYRMDDKTRAQIYHESALELFPRLKEV